MVKSVYVTATLSVVGVAVLSARDCGDATPSVKDQRLRLVLGTKMRHHVEILHICRVSIEVGCL